MIMVSGNLYEIILLHSGEASQMRKRILDNYRPHSIKTIPLLEKKGRAKFSFRPRNPLISMRQQAQFNFLSAHPNVLGHHGY
jgi:hypothetical protein